MVNKTYGTTSIPYDFQTIKSGGSVSAGPAPVGTVGIVGGMDTANGNATANEVKTIRSVQDAATAFGENSELYDQCNRALQNGVSFVYAVAVEETEVTDQFTSQSSGTLDNAPAFDPRVQYEHEIVEDGGNDVTIVDGTPTTPATADTINLNPNTGLWEADASGSYDITYTYGDYTTAINAMGEQVPTVIVVCTENEAVINEAITVVQSNEVAFKFSHVVAGAVRAANSSTYTDNINNERVSLVASSRAYVNTALTQETRTCGAVGALIASQPLGVSTTYNNLSGFTGLVTEYDPVQGGELADAGVIPLLRIDGIKVVKDVTTSTDARFGRVYAVRVADEVSRVSHVISQQFIGEVNNDENRTLYELSHRRSFNAMVNGNPQLLDAYSLDVQKSEDDDNGVDVSIGIDIVNVIDTIYVTIVVGDVVVTNGGTQ